MQLPHVRVEIERGERVIDPCDMPICALCHRPVDYVETYADGAIFGPPPPILFVFGCHGRLAYYRVDADAAARHIGPLFGGPLALMPNPFTPTEKR